MNTYDIIVIGAGHAGIEAALAASRMGVKTLLVTLRKDTIGALSCNPAVGGVGKGQLVKEIDALGGEIAKAADACAIQYRILNASKGYAVRSSRAQIDSALYERYMQKVISTQPNLSLQEAEAERLILENGAIRGIITRDKEQLLAACVIIAAGTFLNGLIHIGMNRHSGGRFNEQASINLSDNLSELGLQLLRFKTGTCPRVDKNSIDFSQLAIQEGDISPQPFSFSTREVTLPQIPCHITYTNKKTHRIITDNLTRSPLYTGVIKATGVRYCPSIEDKVVKFSDRERHQIFLEPEGLTTDKIYPNGLATSLPEDVQLEMLHSIKGLEEADVIRFGYGIEHAVVCPTQLYPTLEVKFIRGLYTAGQINGTTGYEEAAAQGLIAGINAALRTQKREPLILDRSTSYIGVLIDDLTTKGTREPYRMFTSRVEFRLLLREDNADMRLRTIGHRLGLVSDEDLKQTKEKQMAIEHGIELLKKTRLKPSPAVNNRLESYATSAITKTVTLEDLLKRPQMTLNRIKELDHLALDIPEYVNREIEAEVKYEGFIQRQLKEVERFKNLEKIRIPASIRYKDIPGLSREIREKLESLKPLNLGQASRVSGVTPVAISILMVYIRKISDKNEQ